MEKLIVKINPDGKIVVETKGIKGKKCKEYMEIMERLLNSQIVDSAYTDEYYEEENVRNENSGVEIFAEETTVGKK